MRIYNLILIFFIYSSIGWIWESFLCSFIEHDKALNRGFLIGPYCPIYGAGAVLCYLLFHNINSNFLVFIYAGIFCCTIEYITGFILEKFFNKKWWDYSDYPFQIHNRVCLYGFVIFGAANILIVKILTPWLINGMADSQIVGLGVLTTTMSLVFLSDIIITMNNMVGKKKRLEPVYNRATSRIDLELERVSSSQAFENRILVKSGNSIKNGFNKTNNILMEKETALKQKFAR